MRIKNTNTRQHQSTLFTPYDRLFRHQIFLEIPLKIISRNYSYELTSINWFGRKKGTAKFKIKELRSKYLFTLIYCFIEKILLKIKK